MVMRVFSILLAFVLLMGQPGVWASDEAHEFQYNFENARFDISFIEIRVRENGEGTLRFKKRDEDKEISLDLKLQPATIKRLEELYQTLNYLNSSDTYQAGRDLSHLGKITIGIKRDKQERSTSFNYTEHKVMAKLVELYRAIDNQQRRAMDLKLARQFTPLDLPRQLKNLEDELKRNKLAEPEALAGLLTEIKLDDSLPLIARNAAGKLLEQINKRPR